MTRGLSKRDEAAFPRPRMLDAFCGAGGCSVGYHRAGFDVIGVDIDPQPNYPFPFIQADALELLRVPLIGFAAVHASPPCQAYSDLQHRTGRTYPELIEPVREALRASGLPYIIENVEGAPLEDPIMLCGTMFPGLRVLRHRLFESSVPLVAPAHGKHPLVFTHDKRKAHHGKLDQDQSFVQVTGGGNCSIANARAAMGIAWMTKHELNEAIPPAYSEFIGEHLMAAIRQEALAA
jgi:DNA (cytosine-5)-methyltransferase 1